MRKDSIPLKCIRLLLRLNKPCGYCGRPMTELGKTQVTKDHVFPRSKGYKYASFGGKNQIWCCGHCNLDKGNDNILQWWYRLFFNKDKRAPRVLRILLEWHTAGRLKRNQVTLEVWEKFIEESFLCLKKDLAAPEEVVANIVMRIGSDYFLCSDLVPHLELQSSTKKATQPTTGSG